MKKRIFLLFIIITFTFSGCVQKKDENKVVKKRNYPVIGLQSPPKDLTSMENYNPRDEDLICALFEGLVERDNNGEIKPALAKDWKISDDGLTYVFNLNENIFWSDGKEIDAKNFVDFFRTILNPNMGNKNAFELYSIFGAEDYNKGKKPQGEMAIIATDKKTLQIRLNYVDEEFLQTLSKPRYRLRKNFEALKSWKSNYKDIAYTGSYIISNMEEGKEKSSIILEKNTSYYNKDNILSDKIVLNDSGSSEVAMSRFDIGDIDIFFNPPISEVERLKSSDNLDYITLQDFYALIFNFKSPLSSKIDFRKAVNEALSASLDESELIKKFNVSISNGDIFKKDSNKAVFSTDSEKNEFKYDLFSANVKIKNIVNEEKDQYFKILCLNDERSTLLMESLTEIMEREFNIKSKIYYYNSSEIQDALKKDFYDMALIGYNSTGSKEVFFRRWYYSTGKSINYSNENIDKTLYKLKGEKEKGKRDQYINSVSTEIKNEIPMIPVFNENLFICRNNTVDGIYMDGNENIMINKLVKREEISEDKKDIEKLDVPKDKIDDMPIGYKK
ncbi:ABC transporter substrate-binding protein [Clostridium amazonitimonense]|uniref:ABC transporter substrate-binding protein n=1 Tax=Clostridium amazonitimonense TaxID=1499689 RepID=UPI000509B778|nr:ABC transporter substrate-binding protein [Clostridium amazonitimonense]